MIMRISCAGMILLAACSSSTVPAAVPLVPSCRRLVSKIRERLAAASESDVVALVGIGSIFPFLRASSVIKATG